MLAPTHPPLAIIAREELNKADGDRRAAVAALAARIAADEGLCQSIASDAINLIVDIKVARASLHDRETILKGIGAGRESVKALASGILRSVLDIPLLDGRPLRDATHADLEAAVDHYRKQAERMGAIAGFLSEIMKITPKKKKVGEAITAEKANAIWRKYSK